MNKSQPKTEYWRYWAAGELTNIQIGVLIRLKTLTFHHQYRRQQASLQKITSSLFTQATFDRDGSRIHILIVSFVFSSWINPANLMVNEVKSKCWTVQRSMYIVEWKYFRRCLYGRRCKLAIKSSKVFSALFIADDDE